MKIAGIIFLIGVLLTDEAQPYAEHDPERGQDGFYADDYAPDSDEDERDWEDQHGAADSSDEGGSWAAASTETTDTDDDGDFSGPVQQVRHRFTQNRTLGQNEPSWFDKLFGHNAPTSNKTDKASKQDNNTSQDSFWNPSKLFSQFSMPNFGGSLFQFGPIAPPPLQSDFFPASGSFFNSVASNNSSNNGTNSQDISLPGGILLVAKNVSQADLAPNDPPLAPPMPIFDFQRWPTVPSAVQQTSNNGVLVPVMRPVASDLNLVPYIDLSTENGTLSCLGQVYKVDEKNRSTTACCGAKAFNFEKEDCFGGLVIARPLTSTTAGSTAVPVSTSTPAPKRLPAALRPRIDYPSNDDDNSDNNDAGEAPAAFIVVDSQPSIMLASGQRLTGAYLTRKENAPPQAKFLLKCGTREYRTTLAPHVLTCCGNTLVQIAQANCTEGRTRQPLFLAYLPPKSQQ